MASIKQINAQRAAAGAKPTNVRYTARRAQANADLQQEQHANQIRAGQRAVGAAALTQNANAVDRPFAEQQSVRDAALNRISNNQAIQPNQSLVDQYGNPTARGILNQAQNDGKPSVYLTPTGEVAGGNIKVQAFDRLRQEGKTAEEAMHILNSPEYIQNVNKAMDTYGSPVIDPSTGLSGALTREQARAQARNQRIADTKGYVKSVSSYTDENGNVQTNETYSQDAGATANAQNQERSTIAQEDATANARTQMQKGQEAISAQGTQSQIDNARFDALISSVPPEYRDDVKFLIDGAKAQNELQRQQEHSLKGLGTQLQGSINDQNKTLMSFMEQSKKDSEQFQSTLLDSIQKSQESKQAIIDAQEKIAKDKIALDSHRQEVQIRAEKDSNLKSLLARLAQKGYSAASDSNAQGYIDSSQASYDNRLSDLASETSFRENESAYQFMAKRLEIEDSAQLQRLDAYKTFRTEMNDLLKFGYGEKSKIAQAQTDLYKTLWTANNDISKEKAKSIDALTTKVQTAVNQARDDKRALEQLGWTRLEKAITTYGSNIPESLLNSISKMIPGVDVSDVANKMTLAEMKKLKTSSLGGIWTGSSYPGSATQNSSSINVSSDDVLKAAQITARVFGKSVGERSQYYSSIVRRVSAGENPNAILNDVRQDYMSVANNDVSKAHKTNLDTLSSLDLIDQQVKDFGITPESDGPLGSFDSRINSLASHLGLSSKAYNDLSASVGKIRAQLVHDNYGSAVSASELNLAKQWIPDMSLKGEPFLTKIANLRQYTQYLDDVASNAALGLPKPSAPKPINISGSSFTGAGKYSDDDINSALND